MSCLDAHVLISHATASSFKNNLISMNISFPISPSLQLHYLTDNSGSSSVRCPEWEEFWAFSGNIFRCSWKCFACYFFVLQYSVLFEYIKRLRTGLVFYHSLRLVNLWHHEWRSLKKHEILNMMLIFLRRNGALQYLI